MDQQIMTVAMQDDLFLKIPPDIAVDLHITEGTKLFLSKENGRIVLTTEEQKKWERFDRALEAVRRDVKEAGGITVKEIEDAVRKVRARHRRR